MPDDFPSAVQALVLTAEASVVHIRILLSLVHGDEKIDVRLLAGGHGKTVNSADMDGSSHPPGRQHHGRRCD